MNLILKNPFKFNLIVGVVIVGILVIGLPSLELIPSAVKADLNGARVFDLSENCLLIAQGNSLLPISSLPQANVIKQLKVVVTAYSSTPQETDEDPYTTASGTKVRDGIAANNLLPFGTKIRLPELYGDKIFVVEDRMSWKKGYYHIDIWFPSYWEAKSFGAKRTYIEILES